LLLSSRRSRREAALSCKPLIVDVSLIAAGGFGESGLHTLFMQVGQHAQALLQVGASLHGLVHRALLSPFGGARIVQCLVLRHQVSQPLDLHDRVDACGRGLRHLGRSASLLQGRSRILAACPFLLSQGQPCMRGIELPLVAL
jgi:hypothetical protein